MPSASHTLRIPAARGSARNGCTLNVELSSSEMEQSRVPSRRTLSQALDTTAQQRQGLKHHFITSAAPGEDHEH
jgi:hypothetical protein